MIMIGEVYDILFIAYCTKVLITNS